MASHVLGVAVYSFAKHSGNENEFIYKSTSQKFILNLCSEIAKRLEKHHAIEVFAYHAKVISTACMCRDYG